MSPNVSLMFTRKLPKTINICNPIPSLPQPHPITIPIHPTLTLTPHKLSQLNYHPTPTPMSPKVNLMYTRALPKTINICKCHPSLPQPHPITIPIHPTLTLPPHPIPKLPQLNSTTLPLPQSPPMSTSCKRGCYQYYMQVSPHPIPSLPGICGDRVGI